MKLTEIDSRREGLTLLELVTVLAIMAVLAGIVVPMMGDVNAETGTATTKHSLKQLRDVIANRYVVDMQGTIPATTGTPVLEGLPCPDPLNTQPVGRSSEPQICFLLSNPTARVWNPVSRGWNGPYISTNGAVYPNPSATHPRDSQGRSWAALGFTGTFGQPGDPTVNDGWGNPIVLYIVRVNNGSAIQNLCFVASAGANGELKPSSWTTNSSGIFASSDDDIGLFVKSWMSPP